MPSPPAEGLLNPQGGQRCSGSWEDLEVAHWGGQWCPGKPGSEDPPVGTPNQFYTYQWMGSLHLWMSLGGTWNLPMPPWWMGRRDAWNQNICVPFLPLLSQWPWVPHGSHFSGPCAVGLTTGSLPGHTRTVTARIPSQVGGVDWSVGMNHPPWALGHCLTQGPQLARGLQDRRGQSISGETLERHLDQKAEGPLHQGLRSLLLPLRDCGVPGGGQPTHST